MIEIKFYKGGKVVYTPQGYGGQLCRQATKPYEERHGGTAESVETAEAQLPAVTAQAPQQQEQV